MAPNRRRQKGKSMQPSFAKTSLRASMIIALCTMLLMAVSQPAAANTLCVNPSGSHGCYSTIQGAVNKASANDVLNVAAGTYNEQVIIGIPLSLIGAGANSCIIDAATLAHGIFVDGYDNP